MSEFAKECESQGLTEEQALFLLKFRNCINPDTQLIKRPNSSLDTYYTLAWGCCGVDSDKGLANRRVHRPNYKSAYVFNVTSKDFDFKEEQAKRYGVNFDDVSMNVISSEVVNVHAPELGHTLNVLINNLEIDN